LKELKNNETVMIEHNNQLTPGKVVRKHGTPRSYIVETLGGKYLRRNRKHLKGTKALFQPESEIEHNNTNFQKPLLIEQEITNEPTDIAENRINQPTEITQSVQTPKKPLEPKSTEAIYNTRSGRAVKMPTKYSDYVCNSISVNSNGNEVYV
jgi:hypothetical protein